MLRLLPLNLQFFASDEAGGGSDSGTDWLDDYYSGEEGKSKESSSKDENMIPKSRFDSINSKYKELSDSSKTKQAEYDELQKTYDAEINSKKELEEGITSRDGRIEALEGVIKGMLDAELEAIDEEYRELVPSDKPLEEQLDWLRKAKQKGLFGASTMEFSIGGVTNPTGKSTKGNAKNLSPIEMFTMGYGS
jgi:chromosome segregation ATPase